MTLKDLTDMQRLFVTLDRFTPVERIAYGLVSTVLLAALGAILSKIFIK
jgi:hypothetical protein